MTESDDIKPGGPGDAEGREDAAGDPTGPDDAGSRKAEATPDIGTPDNPGQTQHDAPADDAGGAEGEQDRTE